MPPGEAKAAWERFKAAAHPCRLRVKCAHPQNLGGTCSQETCPANWKKTPEGG